jgi:hypothetical protein
MINQKIISLLSLTILSLLLVAPVLAATPVECPSTCSCLLPAKAKDLGYATYCYGKQMVCNNDPKNPMYCYEKPTTKTVPELKPIITTVTTTITKTVTLKPAVYPECPFGCLCTREVDAKAKGLVTCDGKKMLCGYDKDQTPLYCFGKPTTPAPGYATCSAGCSCLSTADAKVNGSIAYCGGKQSLCGYDAYQNPMYCFGKPANATVTTTVPAAICTPPLCKPGQVITCAGDCPGGCGAICEYPNLTITDRSLSPQEDAIITYPQGGIPSKQDETPTGPVQKDEPRDGIGGVLDAIAIFFGSLFGRSATPPSSELHHTLVNCNGVVTDVETDPSNCGSCGVVCETGACANSTCITRVSLACGPHQQNCDGTCADLRFDQNNCGACGNACPADKQCCGGSCIQKCRLGETCIDFHCVDTSSNDRYCGVTLDICTPPGEKCCGGTCANLVEDEQNCGRCGEVCDNPDLPACCDSGCTNLEWNQRHCGECGNRCSESSICCKGDCCDTSVAGEVCCPNGCKNTLHDSQNCGGCNRPCLPGGTCIDGMCTWDLNLTAIRCNDARMASDILRVYVNGTSVYEPSMETGDTDTIGDHTRITADQGDVRIAVYTWPIGGHTRYEIGSFTVNVRDWTAFNETQSYTMRAGAGMPGDASYTVFYQWEPIET